MEDKDRKKNRCWRNANGLGRTLALYILRRREGTHLRLLLQRKDCQEQEII